MKKLIGSVLLVALGAALSAAVLLLVDPLGMRGGAAPAAERSPIFMSLRAVMVEATSRVWSVESTYLPLFAAFIAMDDRAQALGTGADNGFKRCHARLFRRANVSINTMLLFTTIPASAMIPTPVITT